MEQFLKRLFELELYHTVLTVCGGEYTVNYIRVYIL